MITSTVIGFEAGDTAFAGIKLIVRTRAAIADIIAHLCHETFAAIFTYCFARIIFTCGNAAIFGTLRTDAFKFGISAAFGGTA